MPQSRRRHKESLRDENGDALAVAAERAKRAGFSATLRIGRAESHVARRPLNGNNASPPAIAQPTFLRATVSHLINESLRSCFAVAGFICGRVVSCSRGL